MQDRARRTAVSLLLAVTLAAGHAFAATPPEFYVNLLRRGIASVSAGRNDVGVRELRIAAFGLLEDIERFETAQVYIAIASDRLGREEDARYAAQRILAAERVDRRYAKLNIPQEIRTSFERIATKVLSSEQMAVLRRPADPTPPVIAGNGDSRPPVVVPQPQPQPRTTPVPQPQPQPKTPVPQPKAPVPQPQPPAPQPPRVQPQPPAPVPVPVPAPTPVPPTRRPAPATSREIVALIASGDHALAANDLGRARTLFREALEKTPDDRALLFRIAEGLYRARDFAQALRAFTRLMPFRVGEEHYRYYLAVAHYETGDYATAKRELRVALPYIEETPDVARYRAKIEAAIN